MDDKQQIPDPISQNPLDNLTEGISPFQPEHQAVTEQNITPAPEFTPAPVISPAEVAEITQESTHKTHEVENVLAKFAVDAVENQNYQLEAEELMRQAPALEIFERAGTLAGKLNKSNFKRLAGVVAGVSLAVLPAILESKGIHAHGMAEAALQMGPMSAAGAVIGRHKEPVGAMVDKFADQENLGKGQKIAIKVGNAALGAALGAAAGIGGEAIATRVHEKQLTTALNGADDVLLAGGALANSMRRRARQVVTAFRKDPQL